MRFGYIPLVISNWSHLGKNVAFATHVLIRVNLIRNDYWAALQAVCRTRLPAVKGAVIRCGEEEG